MAQMIRTYLVCFYPAKRVASGIQTTFSMGERSQTHRIEAASLDNMMEQVKALAGLFGQSCTASVRVPNGQRKPPGFDKATGGTMFYEHPPGAPTHSPWGKPDTVEAIAPGVWFVSTPSHGGFYLDAERNALVPEPWRLLTWNKAGLEGWYEEDQDAWLVVLTFPNGQLGEPERQERARWLFEKTYAVLLGEALGLALAGAGKTGESA